MLLICAGNYSQAARYAAHHNIRTSQWRYVRDSQSLRGYYGAEIVIVGTFIRDHSPGVVRDIMETAKFINAQWIEAKA